MPDDGVRDTEAESDPGAPTLSVLETTSIAPELTVTSLPALPPLVAGQTTQFRPNDSPATPETNHEHDVAIPTYITFRYRIVRVLGAGGFGRVYLAHDAELDRNVAVKVPHRARINHQGDVDLYLTEARVAASLDHPGIVPVYDVSRTDDGLCFIVSKFIEGSDLAKRIRADRPSFRETVLLVAAVAEALDHAHQRRLVHRDVKSQNILLDQAGRAYLTDFGLALRDEDFGRGPTYLGTPEYMSPEQARGEGHLVDARSDIFSLGIVLYELLTGVRPYRGSRQEIIQQIRNQEIRPPRQLDESVPRELERICLKALAKRLTDRYCSAEDLADDLRRATELIARNRVPTIPREPSACASDGSLVSGAAHTGVVPKGLRSFDATDADFYLSLLPGPHDRDGLPTTLSFWKRRIEETDPQKVFRTGLVYGPSGCGKSSLIKAGLVPRLAHNVMTIVLEATASETTARLHAAVRRHFPSLRGEMTLPDLLGSIRRGAGLPDGQKLLIVLDQFEQWLYTHREVEDPTLVASLRQCDGERLQCLLVVRDDFWMSVTRFLHELDVRLIEGDNSAAVDLFDPRHARRVLREFGVAFEAIPERPDSMTKDQAEFLGQAVSGLLTREGKVIPVQLSLFAEMVKGKEWTPATLRALGGPQGVGVAFLEDTFSSGSAPPDHRMHERAARSVLESLLPGQGTDIKGYMRSEQELLQASGYAHRPRDFDELRRILDIELRLITPVDTGGADVLASQAGPLEAHYQLTHDYLVPSLRAWLNRKQMETRRGRARIRLAERAGLWDVKHERKQLPSLGEWTSLRFLTRKSSWNDRERAMMRSAARHHLMRASAAVVLLAVAAVGAFAAFGKYRADELVDSLFASATSGVPRIVAQLNNYRFWVDRRLRAALHGDSRTALHASLALLPRDRAQVVFLKQQLLQADPEVARVLIEALAPHKASLVEDLWRLVEKPETEGAARLRAACALAAYDPGEHRRWQHSAADITGILISENILKLGVWDDLLRPARAHFIEPLELVFRDSRGTQKGNIAASILADFAFDRPELIAELIEEASPAQLLEFASETQRRDKRLLELLDRVVRADPPADESAASEDTFSKRQANVALELIALGRTDLFSTLLAHHLDPRLRTFLMQRLSLAPSELIGRLDQERDPGVRQALLLLLGRLKSDELSKESPEKLIPVVARCFREDPDSGVHSMADWLLRRWSRSDLVERMEAQLMRDSRSPEKRWYITPAGYTPWPSSKDQSPSRWERLMANSPRAPSRKNAIVSGSTDPSRSRPRR